MTKTVSVQYHAAVDSPVVNERFQNILPLGIYSGAYFSVIPLDNTNINVSALVAEISDGTYQVRIANDSTEIVPVTELAPCIVLRWTYTGVGVADFTYTNIAVADIQPDDIVIGVVLYTGGGSISGNFDYTLRSTPDILEKYLAVIPDTPASMYLWVLAGNVNYGSVNYLVPLQKTAIFTAPAAGYIRKDLIYVDTDGTVKVTAGTPVAVPGPAVAPVFNGKIALAVVSLTEFTTTLTKAEVTDVRNFVIASSKLYSWGLSGTPTNGFYARLVGGAPTWAEAKRNCHFFLDTVSVTVNASGMCKVPFAGTIIRAYVKIEGAVAVTPLIIDINKGSESVSPTSIWNTTQANRLTIPVGSSYASQTSFDVTSVLENDEFFVDIDQYDSGAAKMTIVLTIREA